MPEDGIGNRLIASSLNLSCIIVSCPRCVRTANLPECPPSCVECDQLSLKGLENKVNSHQQMLSVCVSEI